MTVSTFNCSVNEILYWVPLWLGYSTFSRKDQVVGHFLFSISLFKQHTTGWICYKCFVGTIYVHKRCKCMSKSQIHKIHIPRSIYQERCEHKFVPTSNVHVRINKKNPDSKEIHPVMQHARNNLTQS